MMDQYRARALGELSPHVYAIADAAYQQMTHDKKSQSILVSAPLGYDTDIPPSKADGVSPLYSAPAAFSSSTVFLLPLSECEGCLSCDTVELAILSESLMASWLQ